ncbi:MAG: class I SAM-dependent methyltransferase [Candidatus Eisenbacteria bacterium]
MATWNELFERGEGVARFPEREVQEFVSLLERRFTERPLRIWDLCCGAGRHTVAMAARGHEIFASDIAAHGVALTEKWLSELGLSARTAVADMTECPWPDATFHGAVSWDSLHHNTLGNILAALHVVRERLEFGGLLLTTLKSTRADWFGMGTEIEPGTFAHDSGREAGVPHHYFDEDGVRSAFAGWELLSLVELRCDYLERPQDGPDANPFRYTAWGVLARK